MVHRNTQHIALLISAGWLASALTSCASQTADPIKKSTEKPTQPDNPRAPDQAVKPPLASGVCGGLGTLSLDGKVSLLKGRATVRLPRGMTPEDSLTKLFWSSNEDVLELELDEVKVTFRLEEIYQTRVAGMPQDGETLAATQPAEAGKAETKIVKLADGSTGVMWLRKTTDPMYGALYFADRQGIMMVASLLAGSSQPTHTTDLACGPAFERILSTIAPGEIPLDLTSDSRRLMGNPLPEGYFRYNVSHGDTTIEYAGKPAPAGKSPPLAGIYDGLHPQPIDREKTAEVIEEEPLMGQSASWYVHVRKPDNTGRHTHRADAQRLDGHTKLHGFASADSREELMELMALLK